MAFGSAFEGLFAPLYFITIDVIVVVIVVTVVSFSTIVVYVPVVSLAGAFPVVIRVVISTVGWPVIVGKAIVFFIL